MLTMYLLPTALKSLLWLLWRSWLQYGIHQPVVRQWCHHSGALWRWGLLSSGRHGTERNNRTVGVVLLTLHLLQRDAFIARHRSPPPPPPPWPPPPSGPLPQLLLGFNYNTRVPCSASQDALWQSHGNDTHTHTRTSVKLSRGSVTRHSWSRWPWYLWTRTEPHLISLSALLRSSPIGRSASCQQQQ